MRDTAFRLAGDITHAKVQLCQYAVILKYTKYALGMMRSSIPDSEIVSILLTQAEAILRLGIDNEVSKSPLEAGWISPSNRDIQRQASELEERLASDPAKAGIAYDHYTRVEDLQCRRDKLLLCYPHYYE